MAWTAPITFVANTALTAAQMNTYLRDNLAETAPSKATEAGGYFVSSAPNEIKERVGRRDTITEAGTTSSTSFTDLDGTSVGPEVTVTTAAFALVLWTAQLQNDSGGDAITRASVEVSGASSIPASTIRSITHQRGGDNRLQAGMSVFYDDLTPGENTFTMKYLVSSSTATILGRRLIVFPY